MVDFFKMLSPEHQRELLYHRERVAETRELDDRSLLDIVLHTFHSMGGRWVKGRPVYDDAMMTVYLPEMIRRMNDGQPPNRCPICDAPLEW